MGTEAGVGDGLGIRGGAAGAEVGGEGALASSKSPLRTDLAISFGIGLKTPSKTGFMTEATTGLKVPRTDLKLAVYTPLFLEYEIC